MAAGSPAHHQHTRHAASNEKAIPLDTRPGHAMAGSTTREPQGDRPKTLLRMRSHLSVRLPSNSRIAADPDVCV